MPVVPNAWHGSSVARASESEARNSLSANRLKVLSWRCPSETWSRTPEQLLENTKGYLGYFDSIFFSWKLTEMHGNDFGLSQSEASTHHAHRFE